MAKICRTTKRPAANIAHVYHDAGLCPRGAVFSQDGFATYLVANRAFRRASPAERRRAIDEAVRELASVFGWSPIGSVPVVMTGLHSDEMKVEHF